MKKNTLEVFESRYVIDPETGCWNWSGNISKTGYGRLKYRGGQYEAHRFFYATKVGPIPAGRVVMHSCDNRRCVNIDHLSVGTVADNNRDKLEKGRGNNCTGEDHHKSKLTWPDVEKIRASRDSLHCLEAAARFGVSPSTIYRIRNGAIWKRTEAHR